MIQLVDFVLFFLVPPGVFSKDHVRVSEVRFDEDPLCCVNQDQSEGRAVFPILLVDNCILPVERILYCRLVRLL